MVTLRRERFKTIILACLVFISIVLTTRIWLDISIEGIFIMPKNKEVLSIEELGSRYDEVSLIKPARIILNNSGKHTLLYNDGDIGSIYERIVSDAKDIIRLILSSSEPISYKKHSMEQLNKLRQRRNIEIDFPFAFDIKLLGNLLNINKSGWGELKKIDSILIAYDSNLVYFVDKEGGSIYEFDSENLDSNIRFMMDLADRSDLHSYIFLDEVDPQKYGEDVFIPISSSPMKLPKLSATPEIKGDAIEKVASYFFGGDLATIRSMVEPGGTIIYTDGVEKGIKIDKSGLVEYVSYSYGGRPRRTRMTFENSISVATDFINKHLGFPKDTYISSIESVLSNDNLESCIIKYDYRHEGIPIINDNIDMDSPIEIEVSHNGIKRYKRVVREIVETEELKSVKDSLEIIDLVYERLRQNEKLNLDTVKIVDVYLSYFEYDHDDGISMIPVWMVCIENEEGNLDKYILNAESGVILSEPY